MNETFEQMLQRTSLDLPAAVATLWAENDQLRAALAAATQRAEAAEREITVLREACGIAEGYASYAAARAEAAEAVRLAVIKRNDELHNQVHRLKQQCGDLEAKLAEALDAGGLWRCAECHKICTQQEGADDEWLELCDDCWAKATASQQSEVKP